MNTKSYADDPLVPQAGVKRQLGGISDMTCWRWRRIGLLPPPVVINCRNYWRQSQVDALVAGATEDQEAA